MNQRIPCFAASALVFLTGCVRVGTAEAPTAAVAASFPLQGAHPTIELRIDDGGPYSFIVDTGATQSVVDSTFAATLALEVTGTREIASPLGEPVLRPTVRLANAVAGAITLPDIEATSFDLRQVLGSDGPVGVLSVAAFDGYLVTFDYARQRIEIARGALPSPDGQSVHSYADTAPIPELPATVVGQTLHLAIDTGSPGEVTLPYELTETLPLDGEPSVVGQIGLVDATADLFGARLDGNATVAGVELNRPNLAFVRGLPHGNVGARFLQGRMLTVDAANRRVRLTTPPVTESSPAVKVMGPRRYGIRFGDLAASPLPVLGVDEGLPAAAAGLLAGDRIVSMNGTNVEELPRGDRIAALKSKSLSLVVLRGEDRVELSMSLE